MITHKRKHRPFKSVGRFRTIVSVFVKYGFQNLAQRVKLGRLSLGKFISPHIQNLSEEERLRLVFENLGPTFIKLGQLLATRPDLIPARFVNEFKKLHDQVTPYKFDKIKAVLNSHFQTSLNEVFSHFEEHPFATASIAQVYRATLKNGEKVVVKVQRPGIQKIIEKDLDVLFTLAKLLEKYIEESRIYNPVRIVEQFARSLELEMNFVVEANNMKRIRKKLFQRKRY